MTTKMNTLKEEEEEEDDSLEFSPDQRNIRAQVESQLRLAAAVSQQMSRSKLKVEDAPATLSPPELSAPDLATPDLATHAAVQSAPPSCDRVLLERIGADILNECMWEGECLMWTALTTTGSHGGPYGRIQGRVLKTEGTELAHRVVWQRLYGPIPPRTIVGHSCKHSLCQRPDHLTVGRERFPNFEVTVSILEPVTRTHSIKANTFEDALASAKNLPGLVEILSIRKVDS